MKYCKAVGADRCGTELRLVLDDRVYNFCQEKYCFVTIRLRICFGFYTYWMESDLPAVQL